MVPDNVRRDVLIVVPILLERTGILAVHGLIPAGDLYRLPIIMGSAKRSIRLIGLPRVMSMAPDGLDMIQQLLKSKIKVNRSVENKGKPRL